MKLKNIKNIFPINVAIFLNEKTYRNLYEKYQNLFRKIKLEEITITRK